MGSSVLPPCHEYVFFEGVFILAAVPLYCFCIQKFDEGPDLDMAATASPEIVL